MDGKIQDGYLPGIDPYSEMMMIAQKKLLKYKLLERINLHTDYVDTLSETEIFDAPTLLILVMHFLPDDGSKLKLLRYVASHLKVGSELIYMETNLQSTWSSLNNHGKPFALAN